jgi:hypothetical protein
MQGVRALIGLAVPGRPIGALVAEDRSGGVRDRTGPEAPMLTELLTGHATTPRDEQVQDERQRFGVRPA